MDGTVCHGRKRPRRRIERELKQPAPGCLGHGRSARWEAGLGQDVAYMAVNRMLAELEPRRGFLIAESLCDQPKNLNLADGEPP
jgi:hypothetical protein